MSQPQSALHRCLGFRRLVALALLCATVIVAAEGPPDRYAAVDDTRLRNAASEPGEWFTGGRDGQGTYYSPLDQINSSNVNRLGFAWEYRLGIYRGLEATPIVVDGVMYTSGQRGAVYALDARSGKQLWRFNPEINLQFMRNACCDAVNRGIAIRNGVVYVGALDGMLFALDAATGKPIWSADTIIDHKLPYSVTGAPQLTKDLVVIGNGGADMSMGGVRGYVSAYDRKTGEFRWRFYTVPVLGEKNPAPEMVAAAKTWDTKRDPRILGGGTVWDSMSYDADLDLVYFGTSNPTAYTRRVRGGGSGDQLYSASIVALNATTGRMAWHYQTTPGDIWDYDAGQKMILVDMTLNGRLRKVILQANKNGYFYVIDRSTGAVISAKPFTFINWSKGMDVRFRPILDPQGDYAREIKLVYPPAPGAHGWQPMSYNLKNGLVYIPVFAGPYLIGPPKKTTAPVKATDNAFEGYYEVPNRDFDVKAAEAEFGKMPQFNPVDPKTGRSITRNVLKAWNPVTHKEIWVQPVSDGFESMEGGVMSTAGNLVFQGTSMGELRIYAADTGKLLHTLSTGTAMMAAPSTYLLDGVQYVAVMAGYGGNAVGWPPIPPTSAPAQYDNEGRILVFRLDGQQEVPRTAARAIRPPVLMPPPQRGSVADVDAGRKLFGGHCSFCHSGGLLPDLRRMEHGIGDPRIFKLIVLEGALSANGMARFDDLLTPGDAEQIHAYLVDQAHKLYAKENSNR